MRQGFVSTEDELTTVDFVRTVGVTYRRLDYWVRVGYLKPNDALPGSGNWRTWPATEIDVARFLDRMAPLVIRKGAGELTPQKLRRLCSRVRAGEEGFVAVAKGVYVDLVEASS